MTAAVLPRISIAVPSGDMVHAGFAMALAQLCLASRDLAVQLVSAKSSIVAVARNNAVEEARAFGADALLFLDSDMTFPETTLLRLLLHRRDIVGATYARRAPPASVLGTRLGVQPTDGAGLVEMCRIPTGCLLIRMAVFDRLARPYFRFGIDAAGGIVGEDYAFCDAVRAAGLRIWCDPALTHDLGHIGQHVYRVPVQEA